MSDIINSAQTAADAVIETLRDRVRQLDGDILAESRRLEVTTAIRDEVQELIVALTPKNRTVRRPRTERGARSEAQQVVPEPEIGSPGDGRPPLFAGVSLASKFGVE